jgi:hypothetical protein
MLAQKMNTRLVDVVKVKMAHVMMPTRSTRKPDERQVAVGALTHEELALT